MEQEKYGWIRMRVRARYRKGVVFVDGKDHLMHGGWLVDDSETPNGRICTGRY